MHNKTGQQRAGVTLTEVLVAIFVMGIGLLSLLVLFPLGALNMAHAIRDNRLTHSAATAEGIFRMLRTGVNPTTLQLRDDTVNVYPFFYQTPDSYAPFSTVSPRPVRPYLVAPPAGASLIPPNAAVAQNYTGPSYPVYVDPVGLFIAPTRNRIGFYQDPVPNGYSSPGLVRAAPGMFQPPFPPQFVNQTAELQWRLSRWCTNLDEIQFTPQTDGLPNATVPLQYQRDTRYSWGWFMRQVTASSEAPPNANGIDLSIVVYDKRSWQAGPTGPPFNSAPMGEAAYKAQFTFGQNFAIINLGSASPVPNIKPGTWILDASLNVGLDALGRAAGTPSGYFYRVVNTAPGPGNELIVELHTNARATANPGVAVVMEGVAEVYELGPTY